MLHSSPTDPSNLPLIAFTGGGSAGHVTPNLALMEAWYEQGGQAIYIGRKNSVESELLSHQQVTFKTIPSERLRRYFHWANFIMPLIVLLGIAKSIWIFRKTRPSLLFSKGGFVALPPVIGAWFNRIPVIIHESDGSLGLANRLSLPFTHIVCLAQQRAKVGLNHKNIRVTGSPLRLDFFKADPQRAMQRFNLGKNRPLLVIFGGSLGAKAINETIWSSLTELLNQYDVVHVVGSNNLSTLHSQQYEGQGYHQLEYVNEGFADLLALAHLIICRGGANTIAELIALHKPALIVPLSTQSSRGDQALNAEEFVQLGGGLSLKNELFNQDNLLISLANLEKNYSSHKSKLSKHPHADCTKTLIEIFTQLSAK